MILSGWNLEPSQGGSPSKRYWQKVKAVAEAMRHCWHLPPDEEEKASPVDGPMGLPPPHDFFGSWSSSEEGDHQFPTGTGAGPIPPPIRLGVNQSPAMASPCSPTPPAGYTWDSVISEVLRNEATKSLSAPLEGWPTSETEWVTSVGRQIYSESIFSVDLSTVPRQHIRSETDILTTAMKSVKAERVSSDDFRTLGVLK